MEPVNIQGVTPGSPASSPEVSPREDGDNKVQEVGKRFLGGQSSSPESISRGINSPSPIIGRARAGSLALQEGDLGASPPPSVKSTIEEGMGRRGFSQLFFQILGDPEGENIIAYDTLRPFDRVRGQAKIEGEYVLHMEEATRPAQPIGYRAVTPLLSPEGTKYDDYNFLIRRNIKALCKGAKVEVPADVRCIITQSLGAHGGGVFSVSFPDPSQSVIFSTKDLPADVVFFMGGNLNHTLSRMDYNPEKESLEVTLRDIKTGEERSILFPEQEKALTLWQHIWREK